MWCHGASVVGRTGGQRTAVLFPAPNPRAGKDLMTLERFLGCTGAWLNRNVMQLITRWLHVAMQWNAKIVELHSDWLQLNQDSWPCTTLFHNRLQYHMKIIKLQSDWLAQKHECWACKNQESAPISPDPFPCRGDETKRTEAAFAARLQGFHWSCSMLDYSQRALRYHFVGWRPCTTIKQ